MRDGFDDMVETARGFFPDLAQNNNKAWFDTQRGLYKSHIAEPAKLFSGAVGDKLSKLTDEVFTPKVFRINRDVRFSKDKTPYNTHLHLSWQPQTAGRPAWFWGLSPDYFILGLGLMTLKGADLTRFRSFIHEKGDALQDAISDARGRVGAEISEWGPQPLKRVPKPYAQDHPHGDLLRRKSFAVTAPIPTDWQQTGIVAATMATAQALLPIRNVLVDAT